MKVFWAAVCALFKHKWSHVLLFVVVSVAIGALGVWMPPLIDYAKGLDFSSRMAEQLDNSGPYTFAIAFLASSVSLVVVEYLDEDGRIPWRPFKVTFSLGCALLMIVCTILSSSQVGRPGSDLAGMTQQAATANSTSPSVKSASSMPAESRRNSHSVQIVLTLASVLLGTALFLTYQLQSPSVRQELEDRLKSDDEQADELVRKGLEL